MGAGRKVFDLRLEELGPYNLDFSRSGRFLLLGGRKGHLALMDWQRMRNVCEVQACTFLHVSAARSVCSHAHNYDSISTA